MPFIPNLGITSKMNVHRRAAVVLALHLEYQYQLLIVRRRIKLRRGDLDFLTLWLENVASLSLSSSSPTSH